MAIPLRRSGIRRRGCPGYGFGREGFKHQFATGLFYHVVTPLLKQGVTHGTGIPDRLLLEEQTEKAVILNKPTNTDLFTIAVPIKLL